jgi:hypothetical protein
MNDPAETLTGNTFFEGMFFRLLLLEEIETR